MIGAVVALIAAGVVVWRLIGDTVAPLLREDRCTATVQDDRRWGCAGSRPLLRGTHKVAARQVRDGWSVSPLTAWVDVTIGPV